MKNMFAFAFALGAILVIGVFVFWCDVTDSWKNVSRRVSALFPPYSKYPTNQRRPLARAERSA
jgi:hypothetical protein